MIVQRVEQVLTADAIYDLESSCVMACWSRKSASPVYEAYTVIRGVVTFAESGFLHSGNTPRLSPCS